MMNEANTIKVGDTFTTHQRMAYRDADNKTQWHEFDADCIITGIDENNAKYDVVAIRNEVNRPDWQTSNNVMTGGGFSLRFNVIINGELKRK